MKKSSVTGIPEVDEIDWSSGSYGPRKFKASVGDVRYCRVCGKRFQLGDLYLSGPRGRVRVHAQCIDIEGAPPTTSFTIERSPQTSSMTSSECRDAIVEMLVQIATRTESTWVEDTILYDSMARNLGLSRGQGVRDLDQLVTDGRIEFRYSDVRLNKYKSGPAKDWRVLLPQKERAQRTTSSGDDNAIFLLLLMMIGSKMK